MCPFEGWPLEEAATRLPRLEAAEREVARLTMRLEAAEGESYKLQSQLKMLEAELGEQRSHVDRDIYMKRYGYTREAADDQAKARNMLGPIGPCRAHFTEYISFRALTETRNSNGP